MDEDQEKRYAKGNKHMVTVLVSEIYKINSIQITMEKLLEKRCIFTGFGHRIIHA